MSGKLSEKTVRETVITAIGEMVGDNDLRMIAGLLAGVYLLCIALGL